eukprot:NODE_1177_length_2085_cov_70.133537_g991_i0.p1 GENE.NODE_1177_length_2085_cov_70.133537_g991_i0~~NODE_1177_length_2085_cov_70.133537_g991_i0.p1  ORF type:complete len:668 (-),score=135.12 NODE_1177_length_2085_cov_70.133537_g991_i0:80-1897(-)
MVAVEAMDRKIFSRGDIIYHQGDQFGDSRFYLIWKGEVSVVVDGKLQSKLREGASCGELELLYSQPRQATIRVDSDTCECWTLDRSTYRYIMTGTFMKKRQMYEGFLRKVNFLKSLTHPELIQLADALQPAKFPTGDYLIRYGEEGKFMHIIVEGTVEVLGRDDNGRVIKVCEFTAGDCVGELEFIYNHKTVADVRAKTDVRSATLNRHHFELCMGPIVDVLKRNASEENHVYDYYNQTRKGESIKADDNNEYAGFSFGKALGNESDLNQTDDVDNDSFDAEADAAMRLRVQTSARRTTVSSEAVDMNQTARDFTHKVIPKSREDERQLRRVLEENFLFKHLDDREISHAVQAMSEDKFESGEIIIKQGSEISDKDSMHVLMAGRCTLIVDGVPKKSIQPLECFGELELMYAQPRTCTVKAESHCRTYTLDRFTYRHILSGIFIRKRELYTEFLSNISFLKTLNQLELMQLADALQPHKCQPGDYLIQYGEEGTWFYLIVEGVVEVIGRDSNGNKTKVCEFTTGDCVGELEFIHNHRTVADVIAKTELRAAKLNRTHFEMCMGPVKDLLAKSRAVDPVFDYYNNRMRNEEQPSSTKRLSPPWRKS